MVPALRNNYRNKRNALPSPTISKLRNKETEYRLCEQNKVRQKKSCMVARQEVSCKKKKKTPEIPVSQYVVNANPTQSYAQCNASGVTDVKEL
jgi:hypothetical protein